VVARRDLSLYSVAAGQFFRIGRVPAKLKAEDVLALTPVLPVVVIEDAALAAPLARVLLASGVTAIEVTLRTPAALHAIRAIAEEAPEIAVGAGTVLSQDDFEAAVKAGARYALSPGAPPKLLKYARNGPIPFIPGVTTSSEIMRGLDLGYTCFKFFPAEQMGGAATLKALHGPLPQARFCPTGSITPEKAPAYLALENVLCVGGSWVAPTDKIKAGDWDAIEKSAKLAAGMRR
jgi:2-dehydro-3-deoxyphosphogluconate aldolase/(4S)-4-hydroxy-2-oxoglutarate aldolase